MAAREKRGRLWALLGVLIFLLLNFPLMQIFNHDALWGGIPSLVLYLHAVWLVAIVGLYLLGSRWTPRE